MFPLFLADCCLVHLSEKTPDSVVNALDWATTLTSMSSALNWLVFFWGNREMRKEGCNILKKCLHGQEVKQLKLNVFQM